MKRAYLLITAIIFAITVSIFLFNKSGEKEKNTIDDVLVGNLKSRVDWEINRLKDPKTGQIPPGIKKKELEFAQSLPKAKSHFRNLNWVHRGPFNVGGRTRGGVIDINNENRILAGGVSGGIWLSEDAGASWTKITPAGELHSVSCLIQDSRAEKNNIWYYGSGEAIGNSASGTGAYFAGNGLHKSTDKGLTWQLLSSTTSGTVLFDRLWDVIWNIAIDPSVDTSDMVYAAVLGAIYKSSDGGNTWSKVLGGSTSSFAYFTNIICTSKGVLYATLSDDGPDPGIWRSEDGDTWINITPDSFPEGFERIVMDYNPLNENSIYFLAHTPGHGKLGLGYRGTEDWNSLWKYTYYRGDGTDSNGNWQNLSENIPAHAKMGFDDFNAQGSYNLVIKFKPDDSNTIFIGGTNIYRSADAFTTSTNTTQIGGYGVGTKRPNWTVYKNHHPDQHAFCFLPSDPNVMINFNDGGIFKTDSCMEAIVTWKPLNNGYLTTQCYTVNFEEEASNDIMISGLQDNGNYFTNTADPQASWVMPLNGDGSYSHIGKNHDYYIFSTQLGRMMKARLDQDGNHLEFTRFDPVGASGYQFINPFVVDPNDDDVLYLIAGTQLWRNDQIGSLPYLNNYDSITTGWARYSDSLDIPNRTFTALAVSKSNPQHRLYMGTSSRYLYRIDNAHTGDPSFTRINDAMLQTGNVSCIAIDPRDANKVLVVYSNYSIISLVYSEDGGDNWTQVAGNLEENTNGSGNGPSARWAQIFPLENGYVYLVGTSTGLYATDSLNGMATKWVQVGSNSIGNVVVEMLKARETDGLLAVATHANGIYTTKMSSIEQVLGREEALQNSAVQIYPNPVSDYCNISFPIPGNLPKLVEVYDISGKLMTSLKKPTQNRLTLDLKNYNKGIYFVKITFNESEIAKKIIRN